MHSDRFRTGDILCWLPLLNFCANFNCVELVQSAGDARVLYFMMKLTIFLTLFLSFNAYACNLTDEYKDARSKILKDARYAHNACTSSVSNMHYWKEVSKCEAEGGSDVGGGCQHTVGYKASIIPESEFDHCEILKISWEDIEKYLEEYVEENNITRCSN